MTEKWDIDAILDMNGTPQRPDPTKLGLHISDPTGAGIALQHARNGTREKRGGAEKAVYNEKALREARIHGRV